VQGAELTIERASSGGFYKPPFWDSRIHEESQKVYRTGRYTCKKSRARKLAVCIARLDLVPVHYLLAIRYGWDRRKIQRTDRKYRMYWQDMREGTYAIQVVERGRRRNVALPHFNDRAVYR
jgi:hypothetical protein